MKKLTLFLTTIIATAATIWFLIPAIMPNFFTEQATPSWTYGFGFAMGCMMAVLWVVVIDGWQTYK